MLEYLPQSLGELTRLSKIKLSHNKLLELPASIGALQRISELDASYNSLQTIPIQVSELSNLSRVDLQFNAISIPPDLSAAKSLKEIYLGNNRICDIGSGAWLPPSIMILDLRDNKIKSLPSKLGTFKGLERLDLSNNDLASLPPKVTERGPPWAGRVGMSVLNVSLKWPVSEGNHYRDVLDSSGFSP